MCNYSANLKPDLQPVIHCWHVYILKCSDSTYYVGCTSDLNDRLNRHNKGQIAYTRNRLPVKLIVFTVFSDKYKAYDYEKYLKTGSGRAFSTKHLI